MVQTPDFLREMKPGEEPAVDAVLRAAFGGNEEVRLVKQLRRDKAIMGEQVMASNGDVIAYCALSKMREPKNWLCLAPVAVHPDWQGRNIGKRMVGLVAEWSRISGTFIVVLGQVEFYERAGFSSERAAKLTSPYPIAHTLLAGPGENAPALTAKYATAFG